VSLLLLTVVLAAASAVWVAMPLVSRRMAAVGDLAPGAVLDAEARRRVALASLKELEYDFVGGKLDEADYRSQRERLSRAALAAIRSADAVLAREDATHGGGASPVAAAEVAHDCGFANPAGSRFCAGCGARLG
jgi:hypothetical protein